ncbi:NAD-dependent epimerase/dehydratase family protein [Pseudomonas costantinii]|uniref:Epimerase n=1 Tax=Pseudomonas costantinii TaxID=168469 RepID=A0A1S2V467_9PSED|nr:NAD(P)-dependent oxidoreductase [Pseudomonas costantinii]OIN53513.1 epimerase [Pseudomonas costantinii]SEE36181.1 dTDP-6-deoxy-L-talose 4-dehydrogenase (NAD+) [Pseudomonas costantinii]
MKVLVTGASGFIGRHVVARLLERGHTVTAVARNAKRTLPLNWPDTVRFLACDIHDPLLDVAVFGEIDAVIHLAWPGLPNYKALFHFEQTLPADYRFLKALVARGYKHLLITGTCFEYGMQAGSLDETMPTAPDNAYALAKDTLRRNLQALLAEFSFTLQWARLFYTYGEGQNPGSLLALLDRALLAGDAEFPMSQGEQLRDYLPVETVAQHLVSLLEHSESEGIFNICNGTPISVRRLVEEHVTKKGGSIKLRLGHYPYSPLEPLAFWGSPGKLERLLELDAGSETEHEPH